MITSRMIPIQTLLALLTVLMLCSCSQEKPPHTGGIQGLTQGSGANANTSTSPTATPANNNGGTQVADNGRGDMGKPVTDRLNGGGNNPDNTQLAIDSQTDAAKIDFKLQGHDAQLLYLLTEVEAKPDTNSKNTVKIAQNYKCAMTPKGRFECLWSLSTKDMSAAQYSDPAQIASKPDFADFHPDKQIDGMYFSFEPNPKKDVNGVDQVNTHFTIAIKFGYGKTLYDLVPGQEVENPFNNKQMRKFGKNIDCVREKVKPADNSTEYTCWIWGFLSPGNFYINQK